MFPWRAAAAAATAIEAVEGLLKACTAFRPLCKSHVLTGGDVAWRGRSSDVGS